MAKPRTDKWKPRKERDRAGVLRYCPACGRPPKYPPKTISTHIASMKCLRCDRAFTIWIVDFKNP